MEPCQLPWGPGFRANRWCLYGAVIMRSSILEESCPPGAEGPMWCTVTLVIPHIDIKSIFLIL
jgi:hypothetical protein